MKWIEESSDPRVAKVAGVLSGTPGLDTADVWKLTRDILTALDGDPGERVGVFQ